MTLIFVYGTLKRGYRNHHLIAKQTFVAEAWTLPLYRLYVLPNYPGLVHDLANGLDVHGELWRVDDLALGQLDELEDVPHLYTRQDIAIRDCFETVQAYFYNLPLPTDCLSGSEWPLPS